MACVLSTGEEAGWEDIPIDPELYKAATEGDIDTLKKCDKCLDLLGTPIRNTILHIYLATTNERSTDFVEKILQLCPSLLWKANNGNGDIPLHVAARYGHAQIAEALLSQALAEHHQDVESGKKAAREMLRMTNKKKDTALHEAARNNYIDVVDVMTKDNPDLQYFANDCGETPFYLAAAGGHDIVVRRMLQNCTTLAYNGPNGMTALHAAVIAFSHIDIIGKILNKQKSLSCQVDSKGWTPLHYAAYIGNWKAAKAILEIDKSAAYAANNPRKMTALHFAASRDEVKTLDQIISQCPDCCELVDARGWNALHYAGITQSTKVMNRVLRNPSLCYLLKQADAKGNTPLHLYGAVFKTGQTRFAHDDVSLKESKRLLCSPQEQKEASDWMEDLGTAPMGKLVIFRQRNMSEEQDGEEIVQSFEKSKDAQLVVATLIATVTFAAAFTLPGGLRSDNNDPRRGTAVLRRNASFQVFIITDALAMVLATSCILTHFHLMLVGYRSKYSRLIVYCYISTMLAMAAMVFAFFIGVSAMLAPASGLTVVIFLITASLFLFYFIMWNWFNKEGWELLEG